MMRRSHVENMHAILTPLSWPTIVLCTKFASPSAADVLCTLCTFHPDNLVRVPLVPSSITLAIALVEHFTILGI
jgi:hypothetical protein